MNNSTHIIHRQVLNIVLPASPRARQLQDDFARWCRVGLPALLEEICDRLSPGNELICVDKIRIDLGSAGNEQEMSEKIRTQFHDLLLPLVQQGVGSAEEERGTNSEYLDLNEKKNSIETLRDFLLHGIFPNAIGNMQAEHIHEITRVLCVEMPSKISKKSRQVLRDENAVKRIVQFYSDDECAAIAACITGLPASAIRDLIVELFTRIERAVAVNREQLRSKAWTTLFSQMIQQGPIASGESFLPLLCHSAAPAAMLSEAELVHLLDEQRAEAVDKKRFSQTILSRYVRKRMQGTSEKEYLAEQKTIPQKESPEKKSLVFPDIVLPADGRISHAGMILLWPFLPAFFRKQKLAEKENFVNEAAQIHALSVLTYMATGAVTIGMPVFPMIKLLCGVSLSEAIETESLDEEECKACDELLCELIAAWPALKNAEPSFLRNLFLRREGRLKEQGRSWTITVESATQDILLAKLSWSISAVRLPWSKALIYTDWS